MSIVVHNRKISSPHRRQTVQDTSWLPAGPAGSRSAAHGPDRIADDCPKDSDKSHWASIPGQEALARKLLLVLTGFSAVMSRKLLLVGTGFSAVMSYGPLWLVTVCLLSLLDLSLAITVNIGSFI
jgi:hypothetical protein